MTAEYVAAVLFLIFAGTLVFGVAFALVLAFCVWLMDQLDRMRER